MWGLGGGWPHGAGYGAGFADPWAAPAQRRRRAEAPPQAAGRGVRAQARETPTHHYFFFELPGVQDGDVRIQLVARDTRLRVQAVRLELRRTGWGEVCRVKVPVESIVDLPRAADPGSATAQLDDGVLTVRFTKLREPSVEEPRDVPLTPSADGSESMLDEGMRGETTPLTPGDASAGRTFASAAAEDDAMDEDAPPPAAAAPPPRPRRPVFPASPRRHHAAPAAAAAAASAPSPAAATAGQRTEEEQLDSEMAQLDREKEAAMERIEQDRRAVEAGHKLRAVQVEIDKVRAQWEKPAFRACPAAVPADVDKARKHYEELLLRQMMQLDAVQTFGVDAIRQQRKAVVCHVQRLIDALEAHVRTEKGAAKDGDGDPATPFAEVRANLKGFLETESRGAGYDFHNDDDLLVRTVVDRMKSRAARGK